MTDEIYFWETRREISNDEARRAARRPSYLWAAPPPKKETP